MNIYNQSVKTIGNSGIMTAAITANLKLAAKCPTVVGKVAAITSGVSAGGLAILSKELRKKKLFQVILVNL